MRLKTIKQFSKKGRILDVGCAYGFFLEVAEEEGWEGYGVEISEYAARYAKEELGLKVSLGELKEVRYPSEYFEVVTLWDVIEHLPDPLGELKEINRILRKGGIVALSTPAIDSLFAKLSGKRWIGFQCPWEHIYYFSRSTISKLLEKAGFEVVRIGTIGRICDLRYIADRFKLYSSFISRQLEAMIDKFPYLNNFKFYIDPHHTMVAYARKLDE